MRYTVVDYINNCPLVMFEDSSYSVIFSKRDKQMIQNHTCIQRDEIIQLLK